MPIYEFYCPPCHTIFRFLARRVNTASRPPCPGCRRPLRREVSAFAHPRAGRAAQTPDDGQPPMDDARMDQALAAMGGEIENLGEDADPRQAAVLMRRLAQTSGMKFNATVEEALNRMAAGEDPEAVEAEFGEALEAENPFAESAEAVGKTARLRRLLRAAGPRRDSKLYDLP